MIALLGAGASGVLESWATAEEWLFHANGAHSGRSANYSGRRSSYRPPAQAPGAVAGYWYYYAQPVYQSPVPAPGAVAGYWYYSPVRR